MIKHEIYVSREKSGMGHNNAAALIKKAAAMALDAEGVDRPCRISVMLTDNEGIRETNRDFRGIDAATDVLSFPLNELTPGEFDAALCDTDPYTGAVMLGDMMISLERCETTWNSYSSYAAKAFSMSLLRRVSAHLSSSSICRSFWI